MQKHERQIIDAVRREAKRSGVVLQVKESGKHPTKLLLTGAGRSFKISIASSPRDPDDALKGTLKQTRKAIKEIVDTRRSNKATDAAEK